jgi:hypothetical protein
MSKNKSVMGRALEIACLRLMEGPRVTCLELCNEEHTPITPCGKSGKSCKAVLVAHFIRLAKSQGSKHG